VPRELYGVQLLLGAEVNIMDPEGNIDLYETELSQLDVVIASIHIPCMKPTTVEDHTRAYINVMKNPYVNIIGHPDEDLYNLDYDAIVQSAKEHDVLLELNNSSLLPTSFRAGARENDITLLNTCKKYGASIILGSDAHISHLIKRFDEVNILLKETDFPEELIVNTSKDKFIEFINRKRINIPKHVY
jgi:putative hydrolase